MAEDQDAMGALTVWASVDDEGNEIALDRLTRKEGGWNFNMIEGKWRGYPYAEVTREDLIRLHKAIEEELDL